MAFVYIWEFSETVVRNGTQVPKTPGITQQQVALSPGVSVQSAPFNNATAFILLTADEIVSIAIGTNPTATISNFRIGQGVIGPWGVNAGDMLAAIPNV